MKPASIAIVCCAALSAAATFFVASRGWTLLYGDAEAHLDIARRIVDSRTPGYDQIGSVWLPLPHVLMLPLVANSALWRSGLAGAIPSSICFIAACVFLFGAARRIFASTAAASAATACFALNPNLLYLQAVPMTEAVLAASLLATLYCATGFAARPSIGLALGAGAGTAAAALTRYEGWFLIPFVAVYLWYAGDRRNPLPAVWFCLAAGAAPVYWLLHNSWYFSNPLDFYNGPYSAMAIQGNAPYPGYQDWPKAWLYYRTAALACAGSAAPWLAAAGLPAALWKRAWRPVLFLALPPLFYVWSVHSSRNPIQVPMLWPGSYYNSRYGLSAWPLLAMCAGAAVVLFPRRWQPAAALAIAAISAAPWLLRPSPEAWITWKESQVNSEERRAWTRDGAEYLRAFYRPGTGIFSALGDLAGVYREAGIPLREVLQEGNGPAWDAALRRPDLFLREEWAVALRGDKVEAALRHVPRYRLIRTFRNKIEIYKRD